MDTQGYDLLNLPLHTIEFLYCYILNSRRISFCIGVAMPAELCEKFRISHVKNKAKVWGKTFSPTNKA